MLSECQACRLSESHRFYANNIIDNSDHSFTTEVFGLESKPMPTPLTISVARNEDSVDGDIVIVILFQNFH